MSDVTIAAWLNVPILIPMSIMPGTEAGRDRSVGVYYYYYKCHGLECCHHIVVGALYKNLDLKVFKLLHSSMQTSADHRSRRRHVSRMTDEEGETWSPFGISKVRIKPESLAADCSTPVLQHV